MLALAAAAHPRLALFAGLVGFGFLIGLVGHVIRSRTMILTGIMVVAVVAGYFTFVYQPPL